VSAIDLFVVALIVLPIVMAPVAVRGDMSTFTPDAWRSIRQNGGIWMATSFVIPFGIAHLGMLGYLTMVRPKLARVEPRPPQVRVGDRFTVIRGKRAGERGIVVRPNGSWNLTMMIYRAALMPACMVKFDRDKGKAVVLRSHVAPERHD
jgi:hypothetical protein